MSESIPSLVDTQRTNMILRQIRPWFVHNEDILNLLYFLPREDFFPEELKKFAFFDMEVPFAEGRMSHPPKLEGKILSYLDLTKKKSVLEIGTLNGYLTAAMSKIAKEITSFEEDDFLYHKAQTRLKGFDNIRVFQSSLQRAMEHKIASKQKYDVILINQPISQLLDEHFVLLKDSGLLFCFEGTKQYIRAISARIKDGKFVKTPEFEFNLKSKIIQTAAKQFDF